MTTSPRHVSPTREAAVTNPSPVDPATNLVLAQFKKINDAHQLFEKKQHSEAQKAYAQIFVDIKDSKDPQILLALAHAKMNSTAMSHPLDKKKINDAKTYLNDAFKFANFISNNKEKAAFYHELQSGYQSLLSDESSFKPGSSQFTFISSRIVECEKRASHLENQVLAESPKPASRELTLDQIYEKANQRFAEGIHGMAKRLYESFFTATEGNLDPATLIRRANAEINYASILKSERSDQYPIFHRHAYLDLNLALKNVNSPGSHSAQLCVDIEASCDALKIACEDTKCVGLNLLAQMKADCKETAKKGNLDRKDRPAAAPAPQEIPSLDQLYKEANELFIAKKNQEAKPLYDRFFTLSKNSSDAVILFNRAMSLITYASILQVDNAAQDSIATCYKEAFADLNSAFSKMDTTPFEMNENKALYYKYIRNCYERLAKVAVPNSIDLNDLKLKQAECEKKTSERKPISQKRSVTRTAFIWLAFVATIAVTAGFLYRKFVVKK